jgi:bifunctional non-homologous end joining protein LigD
MFGCSPAMGTIERIGTPLIVEATLKNRQSSFVIDGEAGAARRASISDFNRLHFRKYNEEVQLYAFDGWR